MAAKLVAKVGKALENDMRFSERVQPYKATHLERVKAILYEIASSQDIPGGVKFLQEVQECGSEIKVVKTKLIDIKGTNTKCHFTSLQVRKGRLYKVTILFHNDENTNIFACDEVWVLPLIFWGRLLNLEYEEDSEKRDETANDALEYFKDMEKILRDTYIK